MALVNGLMFWEGCAFQHGIFSGLRTVHDLFSGPILHMVDRSHIRSDHSHMRLHVGA